MVPAGAMSVLLLLLASLPVSAATVAWFEEQEPGTDQYTVRMVVTDDYLRIDDGVEKSDYILLDRKHDTIYSIVREDHTVMELSAGPVKMKMPEPFVREVQAQELEKGPPIKGKTVTHYTILVNGKTCAEVAAAKDLLPETVEALKQFHRVLAAEQAVTAEFTPERFRDDCSLAENVFYPGGYLEFGFPVFHRNSSGRVRSLRSIDEDYVPAPGLFDLPVDYRKFSPAKMRAGG